MEVVVGLSTPRAAAQRRDQPLLVRAIKALAWTVVIAVGFFGGDYLETLLPVWNFSVGEQAFWGTMLALFVFSGFLVMIHDA